MAGPFVVDEVEAERGCGEKVRKAGPQSRRRAGINSKGGDELVKDED